jgi:hypothetical protein
MEYMDDPLYQRTVTNLTQFFTPEQLQAMSDGVDEFVEENGSDIVTNLLSNAIQDAIEQK